MENESKQVDAAPPAQATRKRRRGRKLIRLIVVLVLVVGVLIALAPSIVSSGPGTRYVTDFISGMIAGSVEVDDLTVGWTGNQSIKGIRILDTDGEKVVSIDAVEAPSLSLIALLQGDYAMGEITVTKPDVKIIELNDKGETNLARALALVEPAEEDPDAATPSPVVTLIVDQWHGSYTPYKETPIEVSGDRIEASLEQLSRIDASIKAKVIRDGSAGEFNGKVTLIDLFDGQGKLTAGNIKFEKSDAQLTRVPRAMLARLVNIDEHSLGVAGEFFDAEVVADGPILNLNAKVNITGYLPNPTEAAARGEKLLTADITLVSDEQGFRREGESQIELKVLPQTWKGLVRDHEQLRDSELLEPFILTVSFDRLVAPRDQNAMRWADGSIALPVTATDIRILTTDERIGTIGLRDCEGAITAARVGDEVALRFDAVAVQNDATGRIALEANVLNVIDNDNRFNETGYRAKAELGIENVPTEVAGQFSGLGGVLAEIIGPMLNARFEFDVTPRPGVDLPNIAAGVTVNPQTINLVARAKTVEDRLVLTKFRELDIPVPPELLALIKKQYPTVGKAMGEMALSQTATVSINVKKVSIPLPKGGETFDASQILFDAGMGIRDLAMTGHEMLEGLSIRRISVATDGPSTLADKLALKTEASVVAEDQTFSIDGTTTLFGIGQEKSGFTTALSADDLPTSWLDKLADTDGLLTVALDERLAKLNVSVRSLAESTEGTLFDLKIEAGESSAIVLGSYGEDKLLKISDESSIDLTLTRQRLAAIDKWNQRQDPANEPFPVELLKETSVKIRFTDAVIALNAPEEQGGGFNPAQSRLVATCASPAITLRLDQIDDPLIASNLDLRISSDDLSRGIQITAESDYQLGDRLSGVRAKGRLSSNTRVANLFQPATTGADPIAKQSIEINTVTTITQLPTSVVAGLTGAGEQLVAFAGPMIQSLSVSLTPTDSPATGEEDVLSAKVALSTTNLSGEVNGKYLPGQSLAFEPGARLVVKLTPDLFDSLIAPAPTDATEDPAETDPIELRLARSAEATLILDDFMLGLRNVRSTDGGEPTTTYDARRSRIKGKLTTPELVLVASHGGRSETVRVADLAVDIDSPVLAESVKLAVKADLESLATARGPVAAADVADPDAASPRIGRIVSDTTITNWMTAEGEPRLAKATYDTDTRIVALPTVPLDAMLDTDGMLVAFFKDQLSVSLKGSIAFNGQPQDVDLSINSGNLKAETLALTLGDNLDLREDVVITMMVTEEIADLLLRWGNPIFIDAKESKKPIVVRIPKLFKRQLAEELTPFHLPLAKFMEPGTRAEAMKETTAGIDVELGTLMVEKDGWLIGQALRGLLKGLDPGREAAELQEAEFTPWRVQINNGRVKSNDLWMVTDNAALGVQSIIEPVFDSSTGKLGEGQSTMNIWVGMAGETLEGMGLIPPKRIPRNVVYEFPYKGPMDTKPKVNFAHVATKAAEYQAKQAAIDELDGPARDIALLGLNALFKALIPKENQKEWPNHPKGAIAERREKLNPQPDVENDPNNPNPDRPGDPRNPQGNEPAPEGNNRINGDRPNQNDRQPDREDDPVGDLLKDLLNR